MTIRPIIFSAEMVRALLEGRKTQTRRLATSYLRKCEAGDLLYVREHWRVGKHWDDTPPRAIHPVIIEHGEIVYIADATANELRGKHRQGMHMPRWASRLTLRVTDVRTEGVSSISEHDAEAEGARAAFTTPWGDVVGQPRYQYGFCELWNSLHDKPGERWSDNPQIVALTFEVIRGNVDEIARAG